MLQRRLFSKFPEMVEAEYPQVPPDVPPLPWPKEEPPAAVTMPPMMVVPESPVWEYWVIARDATTDGPLGEEELDELGEEHWELAAVLTHESIIMYYMKRTR